MLLPMLALLLLACAGHKGETAVSALPPAATLTTIDVANPGQINQRADLTVDGGSSYQWTLSAGALKSGQGSATVYFDVPSALGMVTLTCTAQTPQGSVSVSKQILVAAPFGPPPAMVYGPGVSGDSLANTRVGGPYGTSASYRFRAARTGTLTGFKKFLEWNTGRSGYSGGAGGTLQFELWTDDGTASHLPAKAIPGAVVTYGDPVKVGDFWPRLSLGTAASVTAGSLYHLVITNIHPDPVNNYVSVNDVFTRSALAPAQPTVSDVDWALLEKSSGGSNTWLPRQGYLPCLELQYGDGTTQGRGWMEVWVGNPKPVTSAASVRERFTVSGSDRVVNGVHVRIRRTGGAAPLVLRVEQGDGTLVESVVISDVPTVKFWVGGSFLSPHTLLKGQTYHLVLQTSGDGAFETYPIRDGAFRGYGDFNPASTFGDGVAEFNPGTGWKGWDQWGTLNRDDGDLQFYFR